MAEILDLNALFNFMGVCLRLCYCCLAFKMGIIVFTKKLLIPKTEIVFTLDFYSLQMGPQLDMHTR